MYELYCTRTVLLPLRLMSYAFYPAHSAVEGSCSRKAGKKKSWEYFGVMLNADVRDAEPKSVVCEFDRTETGNRSLVSRSRLTGFSVFPVARPHGIGAWLRWRV